MKTEQELHARSAARCELCSATDHLEAYAIPPNPDGSAEQCLLVCATCLEQIENPARMDANHWHCLNDSMWSQIPAVQVMAWRMLTRLKAESWAQNLLDILYLDEATRSWAEAGDAGSSGEAAVRHSDCNGVELAAGDSVSLIKDLDVKGSSLTAKRGVVVRNIRLVQDNPGHIEGRVGGQQIVILTKFVKKSG